jgi:hypothetical protein
MNKPNSLLEYIGVMDHIGALALPDMNGCVDGR